MSSADAWLAQAKERDDAVSSSEVLEKYKGTFRACQEETRNLEYKLKFCREGIAEDELKFLQKELENNKMVLGFLEAGTLFI